MSENSENQTELCEVCHQHAERRCSACKAAFYCNADHQKEHWKEHKNACKPYEICHSEELGKHIIATKDLDRGDIIFTDSPIIYGPNQHRINEGPFPCVGCCKILYDQTCDRCPECFWPVCNPDCPGLKVPAGHGFECKVLQLKPPSEAKSFHEYYRFDVLIILRALFLQKANPQKWEIMMKLENHLQDRGPKTKTYKSVEEKIKVLEEKYLKPLRSFEEESGKSILPEISHETIHKIYGILDVNATELQEDIDAVILYPKASLFEHNCVPNTIQTIDPKNNFKITFRAALPIQKGEHITSIYTHILWGTSARRQHLKNNKYFYCACKRCQDPTEMGTYISALRCIGTEAEPCGGTQLPVNPTEHNCNWVCDKCNINLPNKDIMKFVNRLSEEVDKLMAKHPKIAELEDMLAKLLNFLHPNHYLIYSVNHSLLQLYGTEGGLDISEELLNKKLKMCEELIEITRKIDPGNARLSLYLGVLLNEQFIAKFKLLSRKFVSEKREEFAEIMNDILKNVEENKEILQYEINSPSGSKLYEVVCQNENKFKRWMEEYYFTN